MRGRAVIPQHQTATAQEYLQLHTQELVMETAGTTAQNLVRLGEIVLFAFFAAENELGNDVFSTRPLAMSKLQGAYESLGVAPPTYTRDPVVFNQVLAYVSTQNIVPSKTIERLKKDYNLLCAH